MVRGGTPALQTRPVFLGCVSDVAVPPEIRVRPREVGHLLIPISLGQDAGTGHGCAGSIRTDPGHDAGADRR